MDKDSEKIDIVSQRSVGSRGLEEETFKPGYAKYEIIPGPPPINYQILLQRTFEELIEDRSYKVLISIFLVIKKNYDLKKFASDLARAEHAEYGNYLNIFFISLSYKGSPETARLIAYEFAKKNVIIISRHNENKSYPPKNLSGEIGGGVGSTLTYYGKTYVRFDDGPRGEFFISGIPPAGDKGVPKGGTTSVIFVYNKYKPKKIFRLDYDILKKGPEIGKKGWEYNLYKVKQILDLKFDNHDPVSGLAKLAGPAALLYKWGGQYLFLTALAGSAIEIYTAFEKGRAILKSIAGFTGAAVMAGISAKKGAEIGKRYAGMKGAIILGLLSGFVGGYVGAKLATAIADWGYCQAFTPLEKEEWILVEEKDIEKLTK